jgi:hypothetical protein
MRAMGHVGAASSGAQTSRQPPVGSRTQTLDLEELWSRMNQVAVDPKLRILNDGWGHRLSNELRLSVDAQQNPLPWYTYPAIEFLRQFDYADARVFEWGSGYSSLYWADRACSVISVDRSPDWHSKIAQMAQDNLDLRLLTEDPHYYRAIEEEGLFDVIAIDGDRRADCAASALPRLKPGGIIILDNSDWYRAAGQRLRSAGLVQIDFTGFGPINNYVWTTSVFLHGAFRFKARTDMQPEYGVGALRQVAEDQEKS